MEAKFGLRIRDSVTRVCVNTQIPWMLMRSTLSCLAKEKCHRVRVMGFVSAVEHIFNEFAMHARAQASNRPARANIARVLMNGMMTGVLLDGTKVVNKRMTLPQAHSYLEVWMSVPPAVRSGLNG